MTTAFTRTGSSAFHLTTLLKTAPPAALHLPSALPIAALTQITTIPFKKQTTKLNRHKLMTPTLRILTLLTITFISTQAVMTLELMQIKILVQKLIPALTITPTIMKIEMILKTKLRNLI